MRCIELFSMKSYNKIYTLSLGLPVKLLAIDSKWRNSIR